MSGSESELETIAVTGVMKAVQKREGDTVKRHFGAGQEVDLEVNQRWGKRERQGCSGRSWVRARLV